MKKALIGFPLLFCFFAVVSLAQDTNIFLKALPTEFEFVDMDTDVDGNVYVVGRSGSRTTVKKFDSAGLVVDEQSIPEITDPVAIEMATNGYLYLAGGTRLVRLVARDLTIDQGTGNSNIVFTIPNSFRDLRFRDLVYVSASQKILLGAQNPGNRWPRFISIAENLTGSATVTEVRAMGVGSSSAGSSVRAITADDQGYAYIVGESSGNASTGNDSNAGYIAKFDTINGGTPRAVTFRGLKDVFDVEYANGWLYAMGLHNTVNEVIVLRVDTTLSGNGDDNVLIQSEWNQSFKFTNSNYSELRTEGDTKKKKFSLSVDGLDNIYITGYTRNGTTNFYNETGTIHQTIASTAESAFVAKLDATFAYLWIKNPVRAPFPEFGSNLRLAWDGRNERLWWSGSFRGQHGVSMQDGTDSSTLRTLSQDSVFQGFVAAFEANGSFTRIVDFTLLTPYAENRVTLNGRTFGSTGATFSIILDSSITIQTPREIYRWDQGAGTVVETDDVDSNQNIIDNADTKFSFLNFSVNSVVQASSGTTYSFNLTETTTVQLEWAVNYALVINSDFANTASRSRLADGSLYVDALNSAASGLPEFGVGKHWITKDAPVNLRINGFEEDLSINNGLKVRYVPHAFRASGAFSNQITSSGQFNSIEPVQQMDEFTMSGPTGITYVWKLQYGIEMLATLSSADASLVAQYVSDFDGTQGTTQRTAEGAGTHWFDDGTLLRIGAPVEQDFDTTGPSSLKGWLNGDNYIFSPGEGKFNDNLDALFTPQQINSGYKYFMHNGVRYAGRELNLDRPGRVVWNYGDRIIYKTIAVGESISFTPSEIASYGLNVRQKPTLDVPDADASADPEELPTANDFIWDSVAKKFYPVRVVEFDLQWPSNFDKPAKVNVTVYWREADYLHIANSAPVSLIPHPPAGQPDDLVYQKIAFSSSSAEVNDDKEFTATQSGRAVLKFNRITPTGRGGSAQSVVELKVVSTSLWSQNLEGVRDAIIGQKVTSAKDLAGLGTGYTFFNNASYNPFIYNRDSFTGEALWDEVNKPGPVIPVNRYPNVSPSQNNEFVIIWYDDPALNDHMLWPYTAERFNPRWPTSASEGLGRIEMSSGYGSESVGADGQDQEVIGNITVDATTVAGATTFDPGRFEQVSIYNQTNRSLPGFNPNEEHALLAPSQRYASVAPRPMAAYAMRENDLNIYSGSNFTSQPYVLVQFLDKADDEFKMKVYNVVRQDFTNYPNGFSVEMDAGEPVIPFYPLGVVSGATLCESSYAREINTRQLTYWRDHKFTAWAVSGDGLFSQYFYYPLLPDFYWPDGSKSVGDCVAWLPNSVSGIASGEFSINYDLPNQFPSAQGVLYSTDWPVDLPVLKVGETLTFSGGEYASENPEALGLPGVLAWAAGEVVYDDLNPDMREGPTDQDGKTFEQYTCRMISALEERTVALAVVNFPEALLPAGGRTSVEGTVYKFNELTSSLKKRIFYNPQTAELGIKGFINNKQIGDSTLTAAPPAVYVLEPNILTEAEWRELRGTDTDSPFADLSGNSSWTTAVDSLYDLSRNPLPLSDSRKQAGNNYTAGLQVRKPKDNSDPDAGVAEAYQALGPGLALVANPDFLNPNVTSLPTISYVTLVENNNAELGGLPVTLHIIKVDRRERYRGAIKMVFSDNVFDENIILRHTGDFGAKADDLVFEWWYRPEDGTDAHPPSLIPAGTTNPWKLFADPSGNRGEGFYQVKLKGNPQAPELLLADSLWFVRYRHKNESPTDPITWNANPEIPFEWAGSGNSTPSDLDSDGYPDYQAQLAQGWVKRVLDAVNPYEARIREFNGESPATYTSMIQQFGQRYEGPVALNPDKDVIENVGLIELYSTILQRARNLSIDLSTPVSTPGITNALQLASTRLSDFYMMLGNEAYCDALDPMIGFGTNSDTLGYLATSVFTFQNQVSSQIEEELSLLRGAYDNKARPVYNRLFWNFTKGEGEAAYATAYNISDITEDGFIDEYDAMVLYPQGHGDAWGHYLTASRAQYELLVHPFFNWVSRSELYSLQDIVFDVDFMDERKFAQSAAAKAKVGAEVVELTYRDAYVADPDSQWQGYLDTDHKRAWGVEGWSRRAGQAAYFDWVTANALIPSAHPNSSYTGIRKVDRTTVKDIAVISANMNMIQQTYEDANSGMNPLGISGNTVPFDIDSARFNVEGEGFSHFEQIYDRAAKAVANAVVVFDQANAADNLIRELGNDEMDFRRAVFEQDLVYRNELMEIFGSPYAGVIGSGKAYPAGYLGPDTQLYMYVDSQVREISQSTVAGSASRFYEDIEKSDGDGPKLIEGLSASGASVSAYGTTQDLRADYAPSFSDNAPSNWFNSFGSVNYIATNSGGIEFDSSSARVPMENMKLPLRASGYTFEAESSWGDRASPGQLQLLIAKMIQQEVNLAVAIAAWDASQGEITRAIRLLNARIDRDKNIRGLLGGKIAAKTVFGALKIGLDTAKNVLFEMGETVQNVSLATPEFIPKNLPTGGLAISPGDAAAPARGGIQLAGSIVEGGMSVGAVVLDTATGVAELTGELVEEGLDFEIDQEDRLFDIKEALVELENLVGDEGILKVQVYREQEALREISDEYRALLQKGARLIDEREAYNKRVAEITQRKRYRDMTFRISRNTSLSNYRKAFDLAARYAYLAAKAYDYETNLHPSDPGSAQGLLAEIIAERSIGVIDAIERIPISGRGGLSEILVHMKTNFEVLKGQLGLNSPQTETGRFSLRQELLRIKPDSSSDSNWRNALETFKVDDLWELPEFRRYCRPFAAYDPNVSEPGIVIDFPSYILAKKNFFGNNLAGGDNTYDPTNFATKIYSVGTWFEGYLSDSFDPADAELSETPRVYLIPVGSDIMAYPSDDELGVRFWNVLDQKIPVPYPLLESSMDSSEWRPLDTLGGTEGEIRKFSSFRAYHDSGYFNEGEMTFDTRLVGRSVWNTRWLLIIPGSTLNADADAGLQTFIENISDIKLFFQTYGYSGN